MVLLNLPMFIFKIKMRTPQRKKGGKGGVNPKIEVNKLRKKAMKNKMMKKTMLTLAGDDTRVS